MSKVMESVLESNSAMGNVEEGKTKAIVSDGDSASSAGVFVSPWTMDSNQTNHLTAFQHGLGTIPQSLLVMFSPDGDTVYPVQWPWAPATSGNPVTISMTATNITLNIYSGTPLHGAWNAVNSAWTTFATGYWKVIAKASA